MPESRSIAKKLVGHKTEGMYTRYAVMFTDDLKRGVEKLAILDAAPEGGKSGTVVPLPVRGREEKGSNEGGHRASPRQGGR